MALWLDDRTRPNSHRDGGPHLFPSSGLPEQQSLLPPAGQTQPLQLFENLDPAFMQLLGWQFPYQSAVYLTFAENLGGKIFFFLHWVGVETSRYWGSRAVAQ